MPPSLSSKQQRAVMRRFIAAAPPGQLQAVLKSLKVLMQQDEAFFEHAPGLVVEHLANQAAPVVLPLSSSAGGSTSIGLTEHAWFATWGRDALPQSIREKVVRDEGLQESYLEFAFASWDHRALCVVDPLTATVVAQCPILKLVADSIDAADPRGSAEAATLSQLQHFLKGPSAADASVAGASTFTPRTLRLAATLALRDALGAAFEKYARRRYGPLDGASATVAVSPLLASVCGSDQTDDAVLEVSVGAQRSNPAALWSGRWVTTFTVNFGNVADSGTAPFALDAAGVPAAPVDFVCRGSTRVEFSYSEEGNIHMQSSSPIDTTVTAPSSTWLSADADAAAQLVAAVRSAYTTDDAVALAGVNASAPLAGVRKLAKRIAQHIESLEDSLQDRITDASRGSALTDSAMKPLRRKLPVTKQLYTFGGKDGTSSTRDAFVARSGMGGNELPDED